MRELERAVSLKPDNADLYQALGLAYWNLGYMKGQKECYQNAMRAFNRVLTLRRDYPHTREYMKELQERYLTRGELSMASPD